MARKTSRASKARAREQKRIKHKKKKRANTRIRIAANVFRFLDLPAELRNRIYTFLFADTTTSLNCLIHRYELPTPFSQTFSNFLKAKYLNTETLHGVPPILLVSRQLREEGLGIWYESTTFVLRELGLLGKWLAGLEEKYRGSVRHLCFCPGGLPGTEAQAREMMRSRWRSFSKMGAFRHLGLSGVELNVTELAHLVQVVVWPREKWPRDGGGRTRVYYPGQR